MLYGVGERNWLERKLRVFSFTGPIFFDEDELIGIAKGQFKGLNQALLTIEPLDEREE